MSLLPLPPQFGVVIVVLVVACFLGPTLVRVTWGYEYEVQDLSYGAQAPSWSHWFGSDFHGRDLFTRVLYGGQIHPVAKVKSEHHLTDRIQPPHQPQCPGRD